MDKHTSEDYIGSYKAHLSTRGIKKASSTTLLATMKDTATTAVSTYNNGKQRRILHHAEKVL